MHVDNGLFPREAGNDPVNVSPEEAAKSLAPAVGLAEEIEHLLLFAWCVAAAGDFDLDLAAQSDAVNRFIGRGIPDAELECEHRNRCERDDASGVNLESQVRH